ncbi:LysR family transcriptional regulator [Amycolatopsis taiwanensis]|uniref:LysR family transcriptional regulator n=1 Tax=Amycolatopsis taiwanensis TaxID=342230 RepID=A0A9W6R730_9PSEU|nr:LysR family transcriptional regulator [Amycolatopsis taiwanensis]GLY70601.1 LysR family transcriptional regulator [Amycolatopsis taiwanensis]
MISADDLGIFLEVARRGRLTEAAKHLGLNHTTVGRHIAHLERTAEQRLFHREPSGWVLTPAGTRLLEHAEAVEAAVLAAREDCLQTGRYLTGAVRMITPDGFGTFLLAPELGTLADSFPALSLELVIANVHASLSTREFDLAVTIERPVTRAVNARRLADYDLRLYAAPSFLDSHSPISSAGDLEGDPFIWYTEDALCAPTLETLFQAVPAARPVYLTNTISGQICAGRQGLGWVFLPSWIGDTADGLRRVDAFPHSVPHSYWLLVPRNLARLARVRAMSAAIHELVTGYEGLRPPR